MSKAPQSTREEMIKKAQEWLHNRAISQLINPCAENPQSSKKNSIDLKEEIIAQCQKLSNHCGMMVGINYTSNFLQDQMPIIAAEADNISNSDL